MRVSARPGLAAGVGAASAAAQLRQATALLRAAVAAVPRLGAPEAVELAGLFAEASKLAQAGTLRCAHVAGDAGARRVAGETSAAALLSSVSGTSVGKARAALGVAEQVCSSAVLDAALSTGALSLDQVALIAPVALADPAAAERLVEAAKKTSISALRLEVDRAMHARRGELEVVRSERMVHARRYCRTWVSGGGVRLDAFLGLDDGAYVMSALDNGHERLAAAARRLGIGMTHEQLRADALVGLARTAGDGSGGAGSGGAGSGGARPSFLVRVDAQALLRGEVHQGECCEIAGVGPVSVTRARAALGDALWTLLVTKGVDIATVTSTTRVVPRKVKRALELRDPCCVVPGCGATERLQIDHWNLDYNWHGPTELSNLCRLCPAHHRLKTEMGWQLRGGPGRWEWRAPKTVGELAAAHARPVTRKASGPHARGDPPTAP